MNIKTWKLINIIYYNYLILLKTYFEIWLHFNFIEGSNNWYFSTYDFQVYHPLLHQKINKYIRQAKRKCSEFPSNQTSFLIKHSCYVSDSFIENVRETAQIVAEIQNGTRAASFLPHDREGSLLQIKAFNLVRLFVGAAQLGNSCKRKNTANGFQIATQSRSSLKFTNSFRLERRFRPDVVQYIRKNTCLEINDLKMY